jgi:hypothetical protein
MPSVLTNGRKEITRVEKRNLFRIKKKIASIRTKLNSISVRPEKKRRKKSGEKTTKKTTVTEFLIFNSFATRNDRKAARIPVTTLKKRSPLNPNCEKGELNSVNRGLPQWSRKR